MTAEDTNDRQTRRQRRAALGGSSPESNPSGDARFGRTGTSDPALVDSVRRAVLAGTVAATGAAFADAVGSSGWLLGSEGTLTALDRVRAELKGLGPLEHLLAEDSITDILVNGPDDVWVDGADGLRRIGRIFQTEEQVRALAVRLVAAGGRRLDDGCPAVDVRLEGLRVHAVLPPISTAGTLLSIRIRRARVFSLTELVDGGTLAPPMAEALTAMMQRRLNFLVSGATGTGKTTLLSALLSLADPQERIVLVEDAAELNPDHPHAVGLQSRHGNLEGAGVLDLTDLVRQALRMRPDRLVVGECRGAEVRELLAAMNTGHDGGGGTIHANSAEAVPARLSALAALAGLAPEVLALQAASALDVVVHLGRTEQGRRVESIGLLELVNSRTLTVRPALIDPAEGYRRAGGCRRAEGWVDFAARVGWRETVSSPPAGYLPGSAPTAAGSAVSDPAVSDPASSHATVSCCGSNPPGPSLPAAATPPS
ncbi:TadA family conjugal transfer-associated ATPase [Arthrobacter echini]|uniref:TadA family conjugal transfer-associated ATPase n=1 Tax=Arthrobacter echini TaxID=1529066 RepID=A0A4S5EA04_9MICC|nr:TadA family conjugal transfer-associated ATPase [Arthrobacter echini]THJ68413.1 TadA family conjugal transfer-associated ATPase [Arthrobacter echini]